MWFGKKKEKARLKEENNQYKIMQSQTALMHAASTTADAAHSVTASLKRHLEDSIRQFEATVRILTDALIVCDSSGNIHACNPAAESMFAMPSTAMLRSPCTALFSIFGKSANIDDVLALLENGQDDLMGKRQTGEIFPIETTFARLERSNGDVVVLLLIRDLTEINSLRTIAATHETRSRVIFDVSFDGILIVENGKVMAANHAAGNLFKRSPESLLATPIELLVNANDRDAIGMIDDVKGSVEAETTLQDGTILELIFSSTPIVWNDSVASLITVRNMSGKACVHQSLKQNNAVDMIVCFTPDYHISFANGPFCQYYKTTKAQLLGTDIRDFLSESERDTFLLNFQNLTRSSPTRRCQIQLFADDANHLQDWIDHASFDESGNLVEYQRSGRDVTEAMQNLLSERDQNSMH